MGQVLSRGLSTSSPSTAQRPPLYAKATAGMHRLVGAELRGAMTWGKTENSLSLSRRSSAGYRTNTDYEIYNALWQTRLNLPAENKMDLQLGYNEKKFGANSFYSAKYPNQYEHTQRMIASLRGDLGGERLRLLPTIYWDREYDCFELVRGTTFGQNHHIVNNYGAGSSPTTAPSSGRRHSVVSFAMRRSSGISSVRHALSLRATTRSSVVERCQPQSGAYSQAG